VGAASSRDCAAKKDGKETKQTGSISNAAKNGE
jgi:hypothetical protein